MNESFEIVVADLPFTMRRTARWADCDPAGVVYAGRYTDYLLGAVAHFLRAVRGVPIAVSPEVELPCKHMALTFHASMRPDQSVDMRVQVGELREHSFDILVSATFPDGRLAFEGVFSPICIRQGTRQKTTLTPVLREALQPHSIRIEGNNT